MDGSSCVGRVLAVPFLPDCLPSSSFILYCTEAFTPSAVVVSVFLGRSAGVMTGWGLGAGDGGTGSGAEARPRQPAREVARSPKSLGGVSHLCECERDAQAPAHTPSLRTRTKCGERRRVMGWT